MRELKDYFCTYQQTQELIKLGFKDYKALMFWNKEQGVLKLGNSGVFTISRAPLRSQALDFFRHIGYEHLLRKLGKKGYWFACEKNNVSYLSSDFLPYHEAESALIDKLIELETEAQHGK